MCCAIVLTLGLKNRVYGDPYEINDDDDDGSSIGILIRPAGTYFVLPHPSSVSWDPALSRRALNRLAGP